LELGSTGSTVAVFSELVGWSMGVVVFSEDEEEPEEAEPEAEAPAEEPVEEEPEEAAGAEPPLTTTSLLEPSAVPQVVPPGMSSGPTV
jgi:hypothetical protein